MRWFLLPIAIALTVPLAAKDKKSQSAPEVYQKLIDCKSLVDSADRLACYDRQVGELEQAKIAGDLVLTDKEAVKEARKGLFGFKMPSLKIFGGGDDDGPAELETTIASVRNMGYDGWRITLADGAVWQQIDTTRLIFNPKVGDTIKIKQGGLGNYKANIAGQSAIKMKRVE